jgi:hypothetical protein
MGKSLGLVYIFPISVTMIMWPSGWRSFQETFETRKNRHSLWRYRFLDVFGVAACLRTAFAWYVHPEWPRAGAANAAQSDSGENP